MLHAPTPSKIVGCNMVTSFELCLVMLEDMLDRV
jgi:hypothetical protein